MKTTISTFLAFITVTLCCYSCVKTPSLSLNGPKSFSFSDKGGDKSISFSCNQKWNITSSASWARVTPSSGVANGEIITVLLTCDENTTYDYREANITVSTEGITEIINFFQETNIGLIVPKKSYDISKEAQTLEIEVNSNIQYMTSIASNSKEWISLIDTKGLVSKKIVFSIEANDSYEERIGSIEIKQNGGDLSQTIFIKQACTSYLEIEKTHYTVSYKNGEIQINYKSNADVACSTHDTWISVASSKAISEGVINLVIDRNNAFNERETSLLVSCGDIQKEVIIHQSANDVSNQPDDEIWYTASQQIHPTRSDVFGPKYLRDRSSFDSVTGFGILKCAHPVEKIGDNAFSSVGGELVSISIPSQVTYIGDYAFADCKKLKTITIPDKVTKISSSAFYVCRGLEAFYGKYASSDHRALIIDGTMVAYAPSGISHYSVLEGVTSLASSTFKSTYELRTISFPSTLKSIENWCFEGSGIESISIPPTIAEIGECTFYRCGNLKTVTFEGGNLKRIGDSAFSYSGVVEFRYPDGIEYIGSNVLSGCSSLDYIYFPESVISIKGGTCNSFNISRLEGKFVSEDGKCLIIDNELLCFAAKGVESYSFPEGLTTTGICFSENPTIKRVEFPSTYKHFYSFSFSDCRSLTEIYFRGKNPPTADNYTAFQNVYDHCTLYVPTGSEEEYRNISIWTQFSGGIHGYTY